MLQLAAAFAVAGQVLAQNDDCSGAINVVQGANGPYTNSGSTTSFAWNCAFGGSDVWFFYIAPGNGSLTVDTCGGGFDTIMEVFDGTGGCGALSSIGCNDDSCGLQSSVTVSVTTGTTYYIRVGGFANITGSFPVNINGPLPMGGTLALASHTGLGCIRQFGSFYENFDPASNFDLNNSALTLFSTAPGYVGVAGVATFVAPTANAVSLGLGDDDEVVQNLGTPFTYDGGVTTSLAIGSNGLLSIAPGNDIGFVPDVSTILSNPETAWYCWHDYNTFAGGGDILFEEIGSIAYITWNGVWDYGGTSSADANTWQFQVDSSNGTVSIVWQTMSPNGGTTGTGFLVGYSPGGPSENPGASDLSAVLAAGSLIVPGGDVLPLTLNSVTRPVIGTSWNMAIVNIPATGLIGVDILGIANPNIPDLTFLGLPSCGLFASLDLLNAYVVGGSMQHNWSLAVPNSMSFVGLHIYAQSAAFLSPPPNAFGAITSNGLDGSIGDY